MLRRGDGHSSASWCVVVRQNALECVALNRVAESPLGSIGGDCPQKFFGIPCGECSVNSSVPHGETRDAETLIVFHEKMFGVKTELLYLVTPTVAPTLRGFTPLARVVVVGDARTSVFYFGHCFHFYLSNSCPYLTRGGVTQFSGGD